MTESLTTHKKSLWTTLFPILFITGVFPFSQKLAVVGLIVYFLVVLVTEKRKPVRLSDVPLPIWASMAFYTVHLVSLGYSDNISYGLRDLETKMALFLIPLASILLPRKRHEVLFFGKAMVVMAIVSILIAIGRSVTLYVSSGDVNVFFYDSFSFLMHPTYFTMFLNIALLLHLDQSNHLPRTYIGSPFTYYGVFALILLGVVLTSSRAGMIITIITCTLHILVWQQADFKSRMVRLLFLIIVTGFIFAITTAVNPTSRFGILFREAFGLPQKEQFIDEAKTDVNPLSHRMLLWKTGIRLFLQHPFGTGSGDIQDVLVSEYEKLHFEKAAVMKYNPHNQYIQSLLATGVAGLLCMLAMFFPFGSRSKNRQAGKSYFMLIWVIALNGLFESVLEVQRGVFLYALIVMFYGIPVKNIINLTGSTPGNSPG